MKLSAVEWCVLALTGLFLTFTVGYFAGTRQAGTVTTSGVTVLTETEASAEETDAAQETAGQEAVASETSGGATSEDTTEVQAESGGLININTAGAAELETLPGIGASLADRIVTYREENGLFASVEEITNVYGIGDGKFAAIEDLITVGE